MIFQFYSRLAYDEGKKKSYGHYLFQFYSRLADFERYSERLERVFFFQFYSRLAAIFVMFKAARELFQFYSRLA